MFEHKDRKVNTLTTSVERITAYCVGTMRLSTVLLASTIGLAFSQTEDEFAPMIEAKGIYGTLLDTLEFTGLNEVIAQNAPVTIIGPSDQAFGEVAAIIAKLSTEEIKQASIFIICLDKSGILNVSIPSDADCYGSHHSECNHHERGIEKRRVHGRQDDRRP